MTQKQKNKIITQERSIRDIVKDGIKQIEETWFEISPLLADIYHSDLYQSWGYESFADYVEKELCISYRTAMWRVSIGDAIKGFGLSYDDVRGIGYSKMKELASAIDAIQSKKEMKETIKKIKDMSYRETQDFVKSIRLRKETIERRVSMSFRFLDEQAVIVEKALDTACALAETSNRSLALEYICNEWLATHNDEFAKQIMQLLHREAEEKVKHKKHVNKGKSRKK